jgi:hypothetical protein
VSEIPLEKESAPSFVRQLLERFLPIVGIIGALIYAVLRLAYAHFYYPFEVEPEEVGLGQFQILSQSFVGLMFIFLGLVIAVAILTVALTLVIAILILVWKVGALLLGKFGTSLKLGERFQSPLGRRLTRGPFKARTEMAQDLRESSKEGGPELPASKTNAPDRKEHNDTNLWFLCGAAVILVILVFASFRLLFLEADRASRGVIEDGYTISAIFYRIGTYRIITLNVKASHSTVEWKATTKTPSALKRNPQCIVYLGKANGTTVVFNVKDSTTIRFPTNDAVIAVHRNTDRLSPSCYK